MAGELRYLFKLTGSMIGSTIGGLFGRSTPTPPPGGSPPPPGPGDIEAPFVPEASPDLWADFMDAIGGESSTKKQVTSKREVIGVKSPRLIKQPDTLTTTTFDTTSRPGFVEVLLTNSTGSSLTMNGIAIVGLPIVKVGGEDGYIHDDFVDYESIAADGERAFELGNDFICTKQQIEALADYWWKYHDPKSRKHMYVGFVHGTRYDLAPGQRYTLQIVVDNKGIYEDIDSTVELYSVDIERQPGQPGRTSFMFREVEENWEKTTFYRAKFSVSGNAQRKLNRSSTIFVGASTYTEESNYVCDGTADDVQIQAAIDVLAARGGGSVVLSPGTFKITSTINLKSNITIIGSGIGQTVIEKNVDGEALEAIGTSGSELSNIRLFGFTVTKNASDATATTLVFFDYADSVEIQNVAFNDSGNAGLRMDNSDDLTVTGCTSDSCAGVGFLFITCSNVTLSDSLVTASGLTSIYFLSSNSCTVANCIVANMAAASGSGSSGIRIDNTPDSVVSNCIVRDISDTSSDIFSAFFLTGANVAISNCIAKNISSSTAQIRGIDSQAVVSNCHVSGITATGGIAMSGIIADRVSNCEVSDMTRTGGSGGISGVYAVSCTSTKVSNLEIDDATNASNVIGVSVNGNGRMAADITVDTLTTNGTGGVRGVMLSQLNCSVSGANVQNCDDYGIYVSGDDCRVSACYAASNDYGVYVETTADKTVITGNRLTGNTTANLSDNGTNTTTTGNDIT